MFATVLAVVVSMKPWQRWTPVRWDVPLPDFSAVTQVALSGVPDILEPEILNEMGWTAGDKWGPLEPGRIRSRLMDRFSYIDEVRSARSWSARSVHFELTLKTPVARVVQGGHGIGFLGPDGEIFEFPEALFKTYVLPDADLGPVEDEEDFAPLSKLFTAAQASGALPSRLIAFRRKGGESDWVAKLENGTQLLWGPIEWTEDKLMRLSEVLEDAEERFGGELTADLRHFEDGKIVVRPR